MTFIKTGTLALAAAVALTLGPVAPAAAQTKWIMASGNPDSNFMTKNLRLMIADIEKASGGKLTIQLSANDTLIKLDSIKRAVQTGQIPIGEIRMGVYGNEDPMNILDNTPFLAPSYETAWKLMEAQKPYFDTAFGASVGGAMNDEIALAFGGQASPQDIVDATQAAADAEK